jgi:peroxiredoxin
MTLPPKNNNELIYKKRFTFIIDPQGNLRASFGNVDPKMDSIVWYTI